MADGYEDAVIATDDDSVRAIVLPTRFAYAFTNTSGSVTVTLKDAERVNRTLVVAGAVSKSEKKTSKASGAAAIK